MEHKQCTNWTIKVEHCGMVFTITDIAFKDIAESAAKGICLDSPDAEVKVYFAADKIHE